MPQKLNWADRHLFVAPRDGARYVKGFLERTRTYERALASYTAPKSTTMLDGQPVTQRDIQSLLKNLEKTLPKKMTFWNTVMFDIGTYSKLKAKYERALARFPNPKLTNAIRALLTKSYNEMRKKKWGFQPWSEFVRGGPPSEPVTILFCSTDFARVFLKCSGKGNIAKLAKAVSEVLPYVVHVKWNHSDVCLFGRDVWRIDESERTLARSDLRLLMLDCIDRGRQKIDYLRRKHAGESDLKRDPLREPIPESVRTYVWRRDEGKCVVCGSQNRLEFDHIIPVCKGGSNTERNIQLLCEQCNRSKQGRI